MRGLSIHDGTGPGEGGGLTFDLAELVELLGPSAQGTRWRTLAGPSYVSDVDVPAFDTANKEPGPWMSWEDFLTRAREIRQVIDGQFEAIRDGSEGPRWVVLRAVDSSWWEVYFNDPAVEAALRRTFHDVRPARYVVDAT